MAWEFESPPGHQQKAEAVNIRSRLFLFPGFYVRKSPFPKAAPYAAAKDAVVLPFLHGEPASRMLPERGPPFFRRFPCGVFLNRPGRAHGEGRVVLSAGQVRESHRQEVALTTAAVVYSRSGAAALGPGRVAALGPGRTSKAPARGRRSRAENGYWTKSLFLSIFF